MTDFGPGHPEWCPEAPADDLGHCGHWYDCEPCHRCGSDVGGEDDCDCPRHTAARDLGVQPSEHREQER